MNALTRLTSREETAISAPLDEDAAVLAQIAQTAAQALDDATQPDVGYPGLVSPEDVGDVLTALSSLAGGLQQTLAHVGRFLDEELDAGRLTGITDQSTGADAVAAARGQLMEAHAAARQLADRLAEASDAVTSTTAARR